MLLLNSNIISMFYPFPVCWKFSPQTYQEKRNSLQRLLWRVLSNFPMKGLKWNLRISFLFFFCYFVSRKTAVFLETNEEQRLRVGFASSILSVCQVHESFLMRAQTRLGQYNSIFRLVRKDFLIPGFPHTFPILQLKINCTVGKINKIIILNYIKWINNNIIQN